MEMLRKYVTWIYIFLKRRPKFRHSNILNKLYNNTTKNNYKKKGEI